MKNIITFQQFFYIYVDLQKWDFTNLSYLSSYMQVIANIFPVEYIFFYN